VSKYIDESINSIKKQTFINWELVIIDDCSGDNTYEIAKKHSCNNIRVYKADHHYGKIGVLKNECISKFIGNHEYICHVGSDDFIPNNCLEIFVDYMDKHPEIGACCGNFICFNDQGQQWTLPHVANSGDYDPNTLLRYMCVFPQRFFRKSVIDKVGGYSNSLSSAVDFDVCLKIDEISTIHRIKEPITYYYRQHSNQVSTKARHEQDLNAKKALEDALKRRGINGKVINDKPPFIIEKNKEEEHFIWGKK
jgi:glycosyltransferase involved in cell wall biosynthesis